MLINKIGIFFGYEYKKVHLCRLQILTKDLLKKIIYYINVENLQKNINCFYNNNNHIDQYDIGTKRW
jgi:hypothetical protein